MTKVLLCCSAGMSTSLFVQKLKKHADEINVSIEVEAVSVTQLKDYTENADIIVLAPQVKFQLASIQQMTSKPIMIIEMRDYGMMNVEKVLPEILEKVKA